MTRSISAVFARIADSAFLFGIGRDHMRGDEVGKPGGYWKHMVSDADKELLKGLRAEHIQSPLRCLLEFGQYRKLH